jgi:molecular chaperone GrpE
MVRNDDWIDDEMTDGKHTKRVRIKVNGERGEGQEPATTAAGSGGESAGPAGPAADTADVAADAGAPDLSVADAVDVAFDDIMAGARASRAARAKKGAGREDRTAGARPAPAVEDDDPTVAGDAGSAVDPGAASAAAPQAAPPDAATEVVPDGDDAVAVAVAQRDEYLHHLQRLQADFDNYRKRVQRENEALTKRASEGVVESLLPVIDNMQRALAAAQQHEADALVEGVELVAGQFRAVLESHGLEEVPAEPGVPFDPTVHEAVLAQPHDDYSEGAITQVLERGYLLHGRLLRPTKVIVAA